MHLLAPGYRCGLSLLLMCLQVAAYGQTAERDSAPPRPQLAQFQVPGVRPGVPAPERPATAMPGELRYSWAVGSDSELTYRRNNDLNNRVGDNEAMFAPTVFGFVDYRPTNWLATRLETTLEVPIDVMTQRPVRLPNGEIKLPEKRRTSILLDQAYASVKYPGADEFTLGRRNFEDPLLWLYDAALDAAIMRFNLGYLQTEASLSRENLVDGDLLNNVPKGRINNYIVYSEYRGIEDHRFAAYWIRRDDQSLAEGKPVFAGLRAHGRPYDVFNYWADVGVVRGQDDARRKLRGSAMDVGFTFRYPGTPLSPSVTVGYASGTGDGTPDDGKNSEYRQTGLQSNERRFGGLTQFKRYGETLDPELSNIEIVTSGVGFRPAANSYVDLVFHRYRLRKIAEENRNWGLTALMNQDPAVQSKDVGSEIDFIIGFRRLFGISNLGFELRAGIFFPGKAFRNDVSTDPDEPAFQRAEKAVSMLAVIIL